MDLPRLATGHKIYSLQLLRRQQPNALKISADQVHWPTRGVLGRATSCPQNSTPIQNAASVAAKRGRYWTSLCPPICKERDSVRCYAKRSRAGSALDMDKTGKQASPQSSGSSLPLQVLFVADDVRIKQLAILGLRAKLMPHSYTRALHLF